MDEIYFAASIRGGRDDVALYSELIKHLGKYGKVLTEHLEIIKFQLVEKII